MSPLPQALSTLSSLPSCGSGSWLTSGLLTQAYQWLCKAREKHHYNQSIWHFRMNWQQIKTALLRKSHPAPAYQLSPVTIAITRTGDRLECWDPRDSLLLKSLTLHLETILLPRLSASCHHLKGRGGVKSAVQSVKAQLQSQKYRYVARSDAKGYYANIHHTRLLELLREHCHDPSILNLVGQYCERTWLKDGYYHTVTKGISLGCPLSPLMGALYLSPLDRAMEALPGVTYTRFMDDWIILAESRWKLRRAIRVMNQVLNSLGLEQHPDKTFIGRIERGFDFLGIDFSDPEQLAPSAVSLARKTEKITRLYEQGASPSTTIVEVNPTTPVEVRERIGRYQQNWLRWLKGILGEQKPPTKPTPDCYAPITATCGAPLSHHSSSENRRFEKQNKSNKTNEIRKKTETEPQQQSAHGLSRSRSNRKRLRSPRPD